MRYKKSRLKSLFFLFITFILILVISACSGASDSSDSSNSNESEGEETSTANEATSDEPIELVVNSWFANTADVPVNVWEPWKQYVEEKTDGRVQVTIHYNGAMAASYEILEGVQSGLFDVGMTLGLYYEDSQLFPLTIGELPFTADGDPDKSAEIIQQFTKEYEELIWDGLIKVGVGAPPPNYLYAVEPINDPHHLNGKPVRVSNEAEVLFFSNMGAAPTEVAFEELYNSLDKGMIEAMLSTHDVYSNLQLATVAPNFLNHPVKFAQATGIMNADFFKALPEDLQQLFIVDLNPKWEELFEENARIVMGNNDLVVELAESNGGQVTTFSDEELKEFQQYAKPVWENWVEKANEKGYPGEEMLAKYIEISKENGVDLSFLDE